MAHDDDDELWDDDELDEPPDEIPEPSEFPDEDESVREILLGLGITSYDMILVDFENVDLSNLRGQRFDTFGEAVTYLADIGVITFSDIVEMPDGSFGTVTEDCSNPPCN